MTTATPRLDREGSFYSDLFTRECKNLLEKQPRTERLRVELVISDLVDRIKTVDPHSQISHDDALALVLSALYVARFGHSPVYTAIISRAKQEKKERFSHVTHRKTA